MLVLIFLENIEKRHKSNQQRPPGGGEWHDHGDGGHAYVLCEDEELLHVGHEEEQGAGQRRQGAGGGEVQPSNVC